MSSNSRSTRPSVKSHGDSQRATAAAAQSQTPASLDTLIQALKSFGPFPRFVDRQARISGSMEELKVWSDWDIQRDFAAALAGLCVLHTPATRSRSHEPRQARGSNRPNVVAAALLLKDNPRQWNLLCSGNQPLDTPTDNPYGKFFTQSIPMLKAISSAVGAIPLSQTELDNLASANERARYETLAQAEKAFVLWAYERHMPKLKPRIKKRGPQLGIALEAYMTNNDLRNHPTLKHLLESLQEINDLIGLYSESSKLEDDQIQRLHTAGRSISSIIWNEKPLCAELTAQSTGIGIINRRNAVEALEKIAKGAIQVNNLVILATCTGLGKDLFKANFQGPTFVKPPSLPKLKFAPSAIVGVHLHHRFIVTSLRDPTQQTDIQPANIWQSLNRVQPTDASNRSHVHCECIIAVEILNRGQKGKYYIGCPKLSCAPCFLFMEAVNEVGKQADINIQILMEGTHGVWYLPWSIPPNTPRAVEEAFERVLLSSINRALAGMGTQGDLQSNSDGAVDMAPYDMPSI